MPSLHRSFMVSLLLGGLVSPTLAQDAKRGDSATAAAPATRTGKERLGPKWTDEQRIDNCKVPPDKRGTKPRPNICPDAPPS